MVKAWQLDIGSTICGERHGTSNAHLGLRHCLEEGHFATGGGVNFYLRFRPHNFWADLVSWAAAIALPTISKVHLSPANHVRSSCPVVLCPPHHRVVPNQIFPTPNSTSGWTTLEGHLESTAGKGRKHSKNGEDPFCFGWSLLIFRSLWMLQEQQKKLFRCFDQMFN